MGYTLSLTQSQALAALRTVLLAAFPSGFEIVQGKDNLVSEPLGPNFCIFWPITRSRISTNIDAYADTSFTASASGGALTVSSMILGSINVSAVPTLFGPTVLAGTAIVAQTNGTPGGAGTYTLSKSQTIASQELAAGIVGIMQPTQLSVQCDFHGPMSGDYVEITSTIMRSLYGADLFAATGYDVTPLYAGDPRQNPWSNAESQIEKVWSCDVALQINQITLAPQQFAQTATVTIDPPCDTLPTPALPASIEPTVVSIDGYGRPLPSLPAPVILSASTVTNALLWKSGRILWKSGSLKWK
jgi:hypothetical protein